MKFRRVPRLVTLAAATALLGVAASGAAPASTTSAPVARVAASAQAAVTASQVEPRGVYIVATLSTEASCQALRSEFPDGYVYGDGVIYSTACIAMIVPPSTVPLYQLWVFTTPLSCSAVGSRAADIPRDCLT